MSWPSERVYLKRVVDVTRPLPIVSTPMKDWIIWIIQLGYREDKQVECSSARREPCLRHRQLAPSEIEQSRVRKPIVPLNELDRDMRD